MSKKKFSAPLTVFLAIVFLAVGLAVGVSGAVTYDALTYHSDEMPHTIVSGELQIHFLELGNKYTGDCTYIKAGENDILIDAGSRPASVATISSYINQYVTDGTLEYVIVTHAHQDHYAGFSVSDGSLFDLYEVGTIIQFAQTNQQDKGSSNMYGRYLNERDAEIADGNTVCYTAKECIDEDKSEFDLGNGIVMTVLDNKYYHEPSSHENNYSVCTLFTYGDESYLFTGDLEEDGEAALIERNELPQVTVYKAGHHGSKTSSSAELLEVIAPEIVCVCCCAGATEYTSENDNTFPTQAFIDRVAPYTDRVYVTTLCLDYKKGTFQSMNGNIAVVTDKTGVRVICTGDDKVLKEWDWFRENRDCPDAWK